MQRKGMIHSTRMIQYYHKAIEFRLAGDYKNALKYCNKLILIMDHSPEGYSLKAGIYAEIGDKERCFATHDKAIRLADNSDAVKPFHLWVNRASSHIHFREYQKALDDCNIAIELQPNEKACYRQRGHCYEGLGMLELALADFKRAGYQEGIDKLREL